MQDARQEILLKEYEVTQTALDAQNATAWQIGSIFIAASIGVFAFVVQGLVGTTVTPSWDSVLLLSIVALISWGTLYLWFRSYRRWGAFVEIAHRRMHEIESELGMWKNRDVEIVDTLLQKREPDSLTLSEADSAHVQEVQRWATKLSRRGRLMATSVDISIRGIVALLLFGWLGAILYCLPDNALRFGKWYLMIVAVAIPALWVNYPRLKMRISSKASDRRRR